MSVIEAATVVPSTEFAVPSTDFADRTSAMRLDASAYCDGHDLSLHDAPSGGWLIRQSHDTVGEQEVLGCVDERGDGFELMEVIGGFRWSTFDSLLAAVIHLRVAMIERAQDGVDPAPGAERRFDRILDAGDAPIRAIPRSRR